MVVKERRAANRRLEETQLLVYLKNIKPEARKPDKPDGENLTSDETNYGE